MKLLAKIESGQVLSGGLFPDLHGESSPLWKDGENVQFTKGGVQKVPGYLGLEGLAAVPRGLKATKASGESRLYLGAGSEAYKWTQGGGLVNIGSFGAAGGTFQFLPWDTEALISNGVDPVERWPNAGLSAPITAPFTRANVLFKYQTQAFAGGTSNGGQLVEWSSVNSITDWTPSSTNTAGNLRLREMEGDILAAQPISGSIGIYSDVNVVTFTYVGGSAVYAHRRPIFGISAISPYSVVAIKDLHFGLTTENVFVTDLLGFDLIDEAAVRNYFTSQADWDRVTEVYGWRDLPNNMIRWSIPKMSGGMFGLGYRIDRKTWTKFNDGIISGEPSGPFPRTMFCKDGKLLRQDPATVDNDGLALPAFARTKPLALGDRNKFKRINKLSLDMTWSGAVNVKIGYSNHPNDTPNWVITTPAASEIFPDQFNAHVDMVFLSIEIESTAIGATWSVAGAEIYGEITGNVS